MNRHREIKKAIKQIKEMDITKTTPAQWRECSKWCTHTFKVVVYYNEKDSNEVIKNAFLSTLLGEILKEPKPIDWNTLIPFIITNIVTLIVAILGIIF